MLLSMPAVPPASTPLAAASSSAAPTVTPLANDDKSEYYGYYEDGPAPAIAPIGAATLPTATIEAAPSAAAPAPAVDDCAPLHSPSRVRRQKSQHLPSTPRAACMPRIATRLPASTLPLPCFCPSGRRVRVLRVLRRSWSEERPAISISFTPAAELRNAMSGKKSNKKPRQIRDTRHRVSA